jgi:hypothetical protein
MKFEFLSPNCLTFKFNSRTRVRKLNGWKNGEEEKTFRTPHKKFYKKQFVDEKQARRRAITIKFY